MHRCVILIGSNFDADDKLPAALEALRRFATVHVKAASEVLVSYAVTQDGEQDDSAPPYHNQAVLVSTHLDPVALRWELRAIEESLGRKRNQGSVQVAIDLDLVVCEDHVLTEDGLQLPDPAIVRHSYVAIPVAELIPDWVHPVNGRTYAQIAGRLGTS